MVIFILLEGISISKANDVVAIIYLYAISTILQFNPIASLERSPALTAERLDFVEREEIIRKIIYNFSHFSIVFLLYFVVQFLCKRKKCN